MEIDTDDNGSVCQQLSSLHIGRSFLRCFFHNLGIDISGFVYEFITSASKAITNPGILGVRSAFSHAFAILLLLCEFLNLLL